VKKWSNRDDRQTHTHTHRQTHGHQIFYFFIVFRDLKNVQKKHKKWVHKIFFFRMNSILRHSNASRSNKIKLFKLCQPKINQNSNLLNILFETRSHIQQKKLPIPISASNFLLLSKKSNILCFDLNDVLGGISVDCICGVL
jgi:hypothetical protein